MRNESAKLRTKTVSGSDVTVVETEVFVEEKSIMYGEFYAAYQVGLNPKHTLEMDPADFEAAIISGQMPTEVEYKSAVYNIIRLYKRDARHVEVVIG